MADLSRPPGSKPIASDLTSKASGSVPRQRLDDSLQQMDRQTLLRHIEMLKRHSKIERIPVSRALEKLQGFVESREKSDPLLFPVDKRHNPWAEKSKCNLI